MKRYYISSSLILLFALLKLQIFAQGFSPETEARLQKVLENFQNSETVPFVGGISVAIKVDDLALWKSATGYAARNVDAENNLLPGGTNFTPNTLSRIYSVTKTFTSALVLELAKEGVFNLHDPVSKYVPLNLINPELSSAVTLQQLLAHESGYSNYTDEINLQIAVAFQPDRVWSPFEMLTFVHQVAAPGAERRYSSTNYILLGAIIEIATGVPVETHFRQRFFEPLKLTSMFLGQRESIANRGELASPHDNISPFNPIFQLTNQPTFPNAYTNISRFPMTAIVSLAFTGGGIVSNASDVAEWGSALFGGRATSASTLQQIMQSLSPTPDEDGDKLGYGVFSNTRISETDFFIGHDGNAVGYRSLMFYQPERKLTIAVLTNFAGVSAYEIAKALYAEIPDFICGPTRESGIRLCSKGKTFCLPLPAAKALMSHGAYLGNCETNEVVTDKVHGRKFPNEDRLVVFPNPSRGHLSFDLQSAQTGPASLQLYDVNGKMISAIFNGTIEKNTRRIVSFDAGRFPAGVYIGRLQTASGIVERKVVVRK